MTDDVTPVDFDSMLSLAGDRSRYQLMVFLLAGVMQFVSIDAFSINFLAASMDHWCQPPRNVSVSHPQTDGASVSECYRRDEVDSNETESSSPCDRWTYDHSVFTATIVSRVRSTSIQSKQIHFTASRLSYNDSDALYIYDVADIDAVEWPCVLSYCCVKAKFYYAMVADRSEAGRRPAASWNLAYHALSSSLAAI